MLQQCNFDADAYAYFKHPELDRVENFSQGFEEAKIAANAGFEELSEKIIRSNTSKDQIADLKHRIATLTSENDILLKRTFELTEDVSSLTAISSAHRHLQTIHRMLFHFIQQLPSTTDPDNAPHHLLFNVLCGSPNSTQGILHENIRCLLH